MRTLRVYLRSIRRRGRPERRPDDDLDGCALDFTLDPTPDDEIDPLLIFEHRGQPHRGELFERVRAHHERHTREGGADDAVRHRDR